MADLFKKLEVSRKLFHILSGLLYLVLYLSVNTKNFALITILFFTITIISMIIANTHANSVFKPAARTSSPIKGIGSLLYLIGLSGVVLLHQQGYITIEIVVYAFVTLAVGDGVATPVGKAAGTFMRSKLFGKSYLGWLIGIITSAIVSVLIVSLFDLGLQLIQMIVLITIGMTVELILGHKIIRRQAHIYSLDNLFIPLSIVFASGLF